MAESVYKVIELVGTSSDSWERAAKAAVERAAKTLRDLRVAEVSELDMQLDDKGKVLAPIEPRCASRLSTRTDPLSSLPNVSAKEVERQRPHPPVDRGAVDCLVLTDVQARLEGRRAELRIHLEAEIVT